MWSQLLVCDHGGLCWNVRRGEHWRPLPTWSRVPPASRIPLRSIVFGSEAQVSWWVSQGFSGRGHWLRLFFPWRASQRCPPPPKKCSLQYMYIQYICNGTSIKWWKCLFWVYIRITAALVLKVHAVSLSFSSATKLLPDQNKCSQGWFGSCILKTQI